MKLPILYKITIPITTMLLFFYISFRLFKITKTPPIWTIIPVLIILIYVLFPTIYYVEFYTPKGLELNGKIITIGDMDMKFSGNKIIFLLPKGKYKIEYTADYRETIKETPKFWKYLPYAHRKITLYPSAFNYANTTFKEHYELIELFPTVTIKGTTIDGDYFENTGDKQTLFPYGNYEVEYTTKYFDGKEIISLGYRNETIILMPNENTIILSDEEINWIQNYLKEYLELSAEKIIKDEGFPKQIHLYSKNATLSLGDMLFVLCQLNMKNKTRYVPKDMIYSIAEGECYNLEGKIPETTNGIRTEQAVYNSLSKTVRTINYPFGELNQKKHLLDWALSYDIEYGRYVPKEGITEKTHSTCDVATGYLTETECVDADYSGWYTDSTETWWYNEYEYPISSGMIGWRYILELSSKYGIPTTQYLVTKDLELFNKKDPALFELSKKLVNEKLIEPGSHTRYHTRLDKVSEQTAKTEFLESKKQIEQVYNITITGMRTPYLSLVNGNIPDTERILAETGYEYYSLYGNHTNTTYNNIIIEHKPINFYGYLGYANQETLNAALQNLPYIISLDHPWNIMFKETKEQLEENPKQPIQTKALILTAISRGVYFTTVEEIEVKASGGQR